MALSHNEETRDAALRLYAAGLDQTAIAAALRVSQGTVSRWLGALDGDAARRLANATELQRMTAPAVEPERASALFETYREVMAGWGEPSGPEHDSHMHAIALGRFVCFDTETGKRVSFA